MRFWWVNQNQTYRHEIDGGYLWSPKKNKNQARNQFYENMREVAPGDLIFSFKDTLILAIGIAESYCSESPKPIEFGSAGSYWENIGWKVRVRFTQLTKQIRPKDHIELLRPFLPSKYSPLQANGNGLQSVYLASVNQSFAAALMHLIGAEAALLLQAAQAVDPIAADDLDFWEGEIENTIVQDTSIPETERIALVRSRIGQGLFKDRVKKIETHCRITKVDNPTHLIASHCKPWRDATNEERLNGENGLLLTPTIDHLFDRGFIGFENNGELIISPVAHRPSLERMGIETSKTVNVGTFSEGQRRFLEFHRDLVLLVASR
ncbi:HNH endonuclease [Alcaligenaceae bacterium LF4-65]|uniref:HNH endonuclease n=1 Tax=Zwartia hollandica TaxID=324606 RepID=A0A953T5R5_9BURK|nr:HNH endonuclease signature motif containing protein [Zwartia hollandica]MBZ1351202.1 HNH endonuclease [Zwartia hollandica]